MQIFYVKINHYIWQINLNRENTYHEICVKTMNKGL